MTNSDNDDLKNHAIAILNRPVLGQQVSLEMWFSDIFPLAIKNAKKRYEIIAQPHQHILAKALNIPAFADCDFDSPNFPILYQRVQNEVAKDCPPDIYNAYDQMNAQYHNFISLMDTKSLIVDDFIPILHRWSIEGSRTSRSDLYSLTKKWKELAGIDEAVLMDFISHLPGQQRPDHPSAMYEYVKSGVQEAIRLLYRIPSEKIEGAEGQGAHSSSHFKNRLNDDYWKHKK